MSRLNTIGGGFTGYTSIASGKDEPEYLYSTMLFQQGTAPVGWVKKTDANLDDCALTVTNKTTGFVRPSATGGGFSAVFSDTPIQDAVVPFSGNLGATTITTAMLPSHNHVVAGTSTGPGASTVFSNFVQPNSGTISNFAPSFTGATPASGSTGSTGLASGSSGHAHGLSGIDVPISVGAIGFSIKYVDAIMATRY